MQTNYDRQAKLAKAAPLPELEALSKGANPRLVQPFVALGTLNARMAQMQSNKMLQGATAPGSIPTLRDKIEQSLQQMKMQAQQQPSGMPQMPEGTPGPQMQPQAEEQPQGEAQSVMQARAGGLAQLPVNDQMFGYAGGGIIAFNGNERSDVPRPIGEETPLSPEERARLERELMMYLAGEKARAEAAGNTMSAPSAPPRDETPETPEAFLARRGEQIRNAPREPISKEARPTFPFATAGRNMPGGINTLVDQPVERVPAVPSAAAPTPSPIPNPERDAQQANLAKLHQLAVANGNAATSPSRQGVKSLVQPPAAAPARPATPPGPAKPAAVAPEAATQEDKLMDMMMKQFGPQPAVESAEDRLKKRDEYVKNAPDSAEALAMIKHLDRMAKRYEANDEAEKAQQARNASNNLATFLMNTRGSSLGIAAGKANAALQPLLSDQETRRQTYQKQRDEQEMFLGKARYELAQAERLRKEGRYSDAEKHEMEAKKLQEQARGHNIQGLTSLLNAAGVRADRAAGREQQYLMHRERMGELSLQRQRMADEANRIKEQGERTQRENAYARQSKDVLERIRKAQTLLSMPNLSKEQKTKTETLLEGYQREDNDLYERIVVRGDKDYRPSPKGSGGNSALTKKADQIVGVK